MMFAIHKNTSRGRAYFLLLSLILALVLLMVRSFHLADYTRFLPLDSIPRDPPINAAANDTLGFQKILALSTGPSWRTRGLDAAAQLTGLQVTVPTQPRNPPELLDAFAKIGKEQGAATPLPGSTRAWVGHLDLLKYVITSDLETAFIVEDDVDWDVRIKEQTKLVSENVRLYTQTSPEDVTPYGTSWDVLWLGHWEQGRMRPLT
ncbi:hypothetical protein F5Y03DRAFT_208362 [Xylaria venustula]|nr:hypothetical protein F5Y03DRAFT_208362 [Xylaria venustula]